LRGYDIVLGKLMATSLPAAYGLLTIFPVLALPLLMGGVSLGEFWRLILVLLATLSFSLCVGLAVSSFSRDARQAMSLTLLVLIMVGGILPLVGWLQRWSMNLAASRAFLWPSPGYLFSRVFDSSYRWVRTGKMEFWGALTTVAGMGTLSLGVAILRVPRSW